MDNIFTHANLCPGLLAAQCAAAEGCSRIIIADVNKFRLELAEKMTLACPLVTLDTSVKDLEAEVKSLTSGNGVPRLVEATGAPPVVNNCFRLLRKGGKVVLIGIPKAPIHIEDPMPNVLFKSLTLTTVHGRRIFHTWEACEVSSQEFVNFLPSVFMSLGACELGKGRSHRDHLPRVLSGPVAGRV